MKRLIIFSILSLVVITKNIRTCVSINENFESEWCNIHCTQDNGELSLLCRQNSIQVQQVCKCTEIKPKELKNIIDPVNQTCTSISAWSDKWCVENCFQYDGDLSPNCNYLYEQFGVQQRCKCINSTKNHPKEEILQTNIVPASEKYHCFTLDDYFTDDWCNKTCPRDNDLAIFCNASKFDEEVDQLCQCDEIGKQPAMLQKDDNIIKKNCVDMNNFITDDKCNLICNLPDAEQHPYCNEAKWKSTFANCKCTDISVKQMKNTVTETEGYDCFAINNHIDDRTCSILCGSPDWKLYEACTKKEAAEGVGKCECRSTKKETQELKTSIGTEWELLECHAINKFIDDKSCSVLCGSPDWKLYEACTNETAEYGVGKCKCYPVKKEEQIIETNIVTAKQHRCKSMEPKFHSDRWCSYFCTPENGKPIPGCVKPQKSYDTQQFCDCSGSKKEKKLETNLVVANQLTCISIHFATSDSYCKRVCVLDDGSLKECCDKGKGKLGVPQYCQCTDTIQEKQIRDMTATQHICVSVRHDFNNQWCQNFCVYDDKNFYPDCDKEQSKKMGREQICDCKFVNVEEKIKSFVKNFLA